MLQRRGSPRLTQEPPADEQIAEPIGGRKLQRHSTIEGLVVREPDFAHAACAEPLDDAIVRHAGAGGNHGICVGFEKRSRGLVVRGQQGLHVSTQRGIFAARIVEPRAARTGWDIAREQKQLLHADVAIIHRIGGPR